MKHLKRSETSIVDVVRESLAKIEHSPQIEFILETSLSDESVWVDHEQMVAVFCDLGKNAVEAMPEGGVLTVAVTGVGGQVTIAMTDTGCGISTENMAMLFTPYFTTKPLGQALGLGLPMAYAVVKAHGGEMFITSNADPEAGPTGTAIRIVLPKSMRLQDLDRVIVLHDDQDAGDSREA